ncbi:MAG: glycosyltransferase family 9 protein [Thermodesulfobacteriota bacterium]|nr:glycosyltransferase family 9 protein [Thermodesulfobacteriota bacterium]
MNILIVKLSAIGDVVHTLPSLAALRKLYQKADITWVVEEASSDIISNHTDLDRIIVSRRKRWVGNLKKFHKIKTTIADIRLFIKTLRGRRYDLVIDFHGLFKSSMIVLLSGGKRKLGYDSMQELSGLFLNERIPENMEKHAVDRYLDFISYLGADTDNPEFYIPIEEENKIRVEALLKANDIDIAKPFVAINPVAFWDTKLWEDDKFARLCDRIAEELRYKIVFTGSKGYRSIRQIRFIMTSPSVNLEGQTTLRDLAYLYRLSGLLITTDSGPMHIAAAMDTPTVALFGPTDSSRTGPYGKGHIVVRKEMPCSPCFLKKCDTKKCMRGIGVDEVFEAVKEIVNRKPDNGFWGRADAE